MAGGLIQLLAWGNQNVKLNGKPSITFFKKVYQSHSNFSMESITVNFNRTEAYMFEKTTFRAKLGRHGDLVQQIYFVFELPDIQTNDLNFKWVKNLAEVLIDNVTVTIGGTLVDRQYGEFMHINNILCNSNEKKELYNKLIGNVEQMYNPFLNTGIYPMSSPAIKGRKMYIPLTFWFNKDSGSSLPILALQYADIEIVVETRPLYQIYQVYAEFDTRYRAPDISDQNEFLANLVYQGNSSLNVKNDLMDIKANLEVNYYFVDTKEREFIAYNSHEYLIEQVNRYESYNLNKSTIVELVMQNPVKELIWVLKRNDQKKNNRWFEFTDDGIPILQSAKIIFNGIDRISEKDGFYYNYLQPFQHHTGTGKDGVYVYSFSLDPEDFQVTGSCNMSRINKVQMLIETIAPLSNDYGYDLTLYAINYNFLKITSGLAGIVYST